MDKQAEQNQQVSHVSRIYIYITELAKRANSVKLVSEMQLEKTTNLLRKNLKDPT